MRMVQARPEGILRSTGRISMLPRWEVWRNYPEPPKSSKGRSSSHRRAPTPRIPGRRPRPFARHSRWSRITMCLTSLFGLGSLRAKSTGHRVSLQKGENLIPVLSIDYGFLGSEGEIAGRRWWCTTHDPKRYGDALSQRKGCSMRTQLRGSSPLGLLGIRARHSSK